MWREEVRRRYLPEILRWHATMSPSLPPCTLRGSRTPGKGVFLKKFLWCNDRHGPRVQLLVRRLSARKRPRDVGGGPMPDALSGHPGAVAHFFHQWVDRRGTWPVLPAEFFGASLEEARRAYARDPEGVHGALLWWTIAASMYMFRDGVDWEAWSFVVANGLVWRSAALDCLVYEELYATDAQSGGIAREEFRSSWLRAQRRLEAPREPTVLAESAWQRMNVLGSELSRGSYKTFFVGLRRVQRALPGWEIQWPDLPSLRVNCTDDGLAVSTQEKLPVALLQRRPLDGAWMIKWQTEDPAWCSRLAHALELPCSLRALPFCSACGLPLKRDREGSRCRRMNHAL